MRFSDTHLGSIYFHQYPFQNLTIIKGYIGADFSQSIQNQSQIAIQIWTDQLTSSKYTNEITKNGERPKQTCFKLFLSS